MTRNGVLTKFPLPTRTQVMRPMTASGSADSTSIAMTDVYMVDFP